ncbi:MAG: hypothetical protein IIU14_07535 [Ruminococcus sp.]|nr:hypothetical protein [Ruminococcus sp.]
MNDNYDYAMERRLRALDPELHKRFTESVFGLQNILSNYLLIFPTFTDHTELHSMNVIDFCNRIISSRLEKLNADEIYCLLMGCYFHDTGMGIRKKDYDEFSRRIDFGDYFETHSRDNISDIIRDFHNEFSGLFIKKYAALFDIPSQEHLKAIIQISRGHRKTDLTDESEYPTALPVSGGNTICLPYLSGLIRLADEIDVAAGRNLSFLYTTSNLTNEKDIIEFGKHDAIKEVEVYEDSFVLVIRTDDENVYGNIQKMSLKMQKTLDECRRAVEGRTPYEITQKTIELKRIGG